MAVDPSGLTAVLLTGGGSRRMGRDKAYLPWGDPAAPLWKRQLDRLRSLAPAHLLISARAGQEFPGLVDAEIVRDPEADCGPLAALLPFRSELLLALPVDMPAATTDFLRRLIARADPDRGLVLHDANRGRYEPFPALYPRAILPLVRRRLDQGELSLQDLIAEAVDAELLRSNPVDENERHFFQNINTPDDFAAS